MPVELNSCSKIKVRWWLADQAANKGNKEGRKIVTLFFLPQISFI